MNKNQIQTVDRLTNFEFIGQSLSKICRFSGRIPFYSVLSHCLVVGGLTKKDDSELELEALLHDSEEPFVGDTPHPFKMPHQRALGDQIRKRVFKNLGVDYPTVEDWDRITYFDHIACSAEWEIFNVEKQEHWENRPETTELALHLTKRYTLPIGSFHWAWLGRYFADQCELLKARQCKSS